jgi:hypothetical protein
VVHHLWCTALDPYGAMRGNDPCPTPPPRPHERPCVPPPSPDRDCSTLPPPRVHGTLLPRPRPCLGVPLHAILAHMPQRRSSTTATSFPHTQSSDLCADRKDMWVSPPPPF